MRDLGIDMNNPEDISKFLQDLGTQDPDLLILFESAVNGLMNEEPTQETPMQGNIPDIPDPAKEFVPTSGGGGGGVPSLMDRNQDVGRGVLR